MKAERVEKDEIVRLTSAEMYALISASLPLLFLDKNAFITHVSANYKSCHSAVCDRTVLQSAISDGFELLCKFCRGDLEAFDGTGHVFSLELPPYTNGVFFRVSPCGESVNMLCLVKNEAELSAVLSLAEYTVTGDVRRFLEENSEAAVNSLLYNVFALREVEDDMSAYEAYLITRGLSERIGRRRIRAFSTVCFNGYADERNAAHISGLCPSSYALAFMSALRLLDAVSDSKIINVSFYGSGAIQTEVSTEAETFFGIHEYSGYLHGLIPCITEGIVPLVSAALSADEASLTAEAVVRNGKVSIVLSSAGAEYPVMDFKLDDVNERLDRLFDLALTQSFLHEFILPQEAVPTEE